MTEDLFIDQNYRSGPSPSSCLHVRTNGFGAPTAIKTKKFWLAAFTQDNEDDPFMIVRIELPRKSTEAAIKLAVTAGKQWMDTDDMVWEILIHDGPTQVPATGDAILARLSREQFNESMELIIND